MLVGALVLAVVLAGGLVLFRSHEFSDGPVSGGASPLDYAHRSGIGERFSVGVLLTNSAGKPATIERVRLLGVTDGLEVLGVRSRPVPDEYGKGMFIGALDYPPSEWSTKPLADQRVVPVATERTPSGEPGNGLQLVIGVRATRPGIARLRAVEYTYRVGSRRYRATYGGSTFLCAPAEQYDSQSCPGDAGESFSDKAVEAKSG